MAASLLKRQFNAIYSSILHQQTTLRHIQIRRIASANINRSKGDRERIVILGGGWGGYVLASHLSPKKYQTVVVSPRSYFAFTPLLSDACVGNLDFDATVEPIRTKRSDAEYFQAWADSVDFTNKRVTIEECVLDTRSTSALIADRFEGLSQDAVQQVQSVKKRQGKLFDISYDKLVIAVGCYAQTFGTKGVREYSFFLKDVGDARKIRRRIFEVFEIAALPTTTDEMRRALLHFVLVGGGPTGMELAGSLNDLIQEDLLKIYAFLQPYVKITVYDVAPKVLSMFDSSLAEYAMRIYQRAGISVKTSHHVLELRPGLPNQKGENLTGMLTIKTQEDGEQGIGMCVWATGNKANPFIKSQLNVQRDFPRHSATSNTNFTAETGLWEIKKDPKTKSIYVDDLLRVKLQTTDKLPHKAQAVMQDVFAIGDCAVLEGGPLPATAQVANQEALYLAKVLNHYTSTESRPFEFHNKGIMTYLGDRRGLFQSRTSQMEGRKAWLAWKGTYIYLSLSWRRRLMVASYWVLNAIWGRDISRY